MLCWCCGLWLLGFGGGQIKFFSGAPVKLGLSLVWKNRLRHTVADICTCHWKVCVHSYSNSLFFFLTFALSLTHAIKQSASHQSPGSLPSPPPSSLSPPLSLSCKHYPSNGSLEDTKTSSYLTPDTNLRALTVVYLGIKHTHKATWAPRKKNRQSRHAINPPPSHTLHPSSPQTLSSSEEPYSLTYLCTSTTNRYRSVCMCVCVCVCVCVVVHTYKCARKLCLCVYLCMPGPYRGNWRLTQVYSAEASETPRVAGGSNLGVYSGFSCETTWKPTKGPSPPSPVPLFLSASHSTKERNEWMKEQQRKGDEVRGWGCKGGAGWGSGARWVLVSGQNRGGGIFSPLCYGTIVGLGTWLVMALHYKPVGALHLRVEVYVDVHFSETPSEWFLIQSLYLKDFSGTAHKSLPPCVSSKSSCVVIQINSRLHQFKVWQSKCVLTFQQWEWFLEF